MSRIELYLIFLLIGGLNLQGLTRYGMTQAIKCLQGGSWFCKHLYHCVIGLVIFALAFVQAIAGFVHHDWMRQAIIIISMINGGLGLLMASDATRSQQIAYDVVAAVVWAAMIT